MTKDKIVKIIYVIFVVIIVTLLLVNDNGVVKYFNLKTEIKELDEKIESIKTRIVKLNSEIDSLQNSDVKIEQVAREKYRMKYEDEIPVRINKQ